MRAHKALLSVASVFVVSALAQSAHADAVTLECTYVAPGAPSLAGQQYTIDVDLGGGAMRYANTTYRINRTSGRYVYFGGGSDPYTAGSPWRLDRKAGVIEARQAGTNTWQRQSTCRRLQGDLLK